MSQELEMLAEEAAAIEAADLAGVPPIPGQEPAPVVDPSQEWVDLARFGADLVLAPIPELKPEWTGERVEAFGMALARCAEHYGWTTGGVLGHPLFGLAVAAYPLGVPVVRMVKASKEKAKNPKPALDGVEPAPAGDGIQIVLGGG